MANRPTTLAHTDFRLDNFFFGRADAPVTIIDWQLTVRSSGAFDVGYFIVESMTTDMRREHGDALLRRWHRGLVDRGVVGYTIDDAYADFHGSDDRFVGAVASARRRSSRGRGSGERIRHGHLAYDSGEFKTVFLRPVMRSAKETSLEAHFVLQPA